MTSNHGKCPCPHHGMGAIFLVLIGLVFLLKNLNVIDEHTASIAWPAVVIVAGLTKICSHWCKCCKDNH